MSTRLEPCNTDHNKGATMQDSSISRGGRAGQIIITFAIVIAVLFGFMGLAIDAGYFYFVRRTMQTAADSGAMAGAQELRRGQTDEVEPSALRDAAANGFSDENGALVSV